MLGVFTQCLTEKEAGLYQWFLAVNKTSWLCGSIPVDIWLLGDLDAYRFHSVLCGSAWHPSEGTAFHSLLLIFPQLKLGSTRFASYLRSASALVTSRMWSS